ncbi:hypothetical protein M404DRAFT_247576 [Pisolithus tinctorius Marx 270]|uniref:Uncharacterized protein n=1 Tax=Pisolithus tinctorius Marx 270 TaxID=870435 RepID=A0A0C3N5K9_PISTI|nr:hypothetical protein M404DRAFT_247576 [Pisolithus tinctorius Marx 270]
MLAHFEGHFLHTVRFFIIGQILLSFLSIYRSKICRIAITPTLRSFPSSSYLQNLGILKYWTLQVPRHLVDELQSDATRVTRTIYTYTHVTSSQPSRS